MEALEILEGPTRGHRMNRSGGSVIEKTAKRSYQYT